MKKIRIDTRYTLVSMCIFSVIAVWMLTKPTGEQWASWVQAIGSVAAILFTGYFAADADNRAIKRKSAAVYAIVLSAHHKMIDLRVILTDEDKLLPELAFGKIEDYLREPSKAIAAIPLHELGSYDMVVGVQTTSELLTKLRADIAEALDSVSHDARVAILKSIGSRIPMTKDAPGLLLFQQGMARLR